MIFFKPKIKSKNKTKNKPKKRVAYYVSTVLFYLILFFTLILSLSIWLLDTPMGFKILVNHSSTIFKPYFPQKNIKITGAVQGVFNNFKIDQVQIGSLTFHHLEIQWHLRNLFHPELSLSHFSSLVSFNTYQMPVSLSGAYHFTSLFPASLSFFNSYFNSKTQTPAQSQNSLFNFQGQIALKKSAQDLLHLNFQMGGSAQHYQFSAHGLGDLWDHPGHLIIQGIGSGYLFHTEELVFTPSSNSSGSGVLNGQVNLNFSPLWAIKINLQGTNLSLETHDIDPAHRLNFSLDLSANSKNQTASLQIQSGQANQLNQFHTQIKLSRDQTGLTKIQPVKIYTSAGLWAFPETQFLLTPDLINFPKTCLSHLNLNTQNSLLCLSALFQKNNLSTPLMADLSLQLPDLKLLQDFFPELSELEGSIFGTLHIQGPLSQLIYTSHMQLKDGKIGLPNKGVILDQIQATLSSDKSTHLNINLQGRSGEGLFNIKGSAFYQDALLNLALGIDGQDLTLINLPIAHITGSPHLVYTQNASVMALTGSVLISSADIHADQYQQYLSMGLKESPDVVLVNNQDQIIVQNKTLPFALNIILNAQNPINFQGFGINTQITGSLNITSFANQPSFANGTLNLLQGQYQAYGKHFIIQKGALIFNHSPLNNPNLDITAIYQLTTISPGAGSSSSNNLTIGVKVSGTLQKIHLSLFSNPSMSQENILSYMLTGQPLSQAGPASQSAISQAALSLASGGSDQTVLNSIQEKLKLNQLNIGSLNNLPSNNLAQSRESTSPDQDNTAVFIGKAITPRLFISYGVGLFNNEQIFMTHFKLSDHFYVQTDNSNLDSGADIFYTFEH